jgi:hypothetical protein
MAIPHAVPGLSNVIQAVADEVRSASAKNPGFNSAHEAAAVIREEYEEFWEIVKLKTEKRNLQYMRDELIQIAAMACRAVVDLRL